MTDQIQHFHFHDQRPSHRAVPDIVVEARRAAQRAWALVSDLSDAFDEGDSSFAEIESAKLAAKAADAWKEQVCDAWMRGDEAAVACYCTPNSDACDVCKAQTVFRERE